MAKAPKPGPTEAPKFQKVVDHFLKTPPRKHEAEKKGGKPKVAAPAKDQSTS